MNLGTIKNTIRTLNASPLPTRWTDQLLAQLINQGSNQLVIDVNYPEATMTWSTNPPPSAPTVVYTGAAGTTSYVYALAAVATVPLGTATSTGGDSAPGASVTSANAAATLDATHYNTLTFGSLKGTTYKVLRQIAGTDTTWQYIGSTTATGATTTFKDNGLASQAYVVSRGNEYELPQLVKILRVYLADTAG
ncbi:MAG: hypothetical protein KGL39_08940, partial [Patescibacteria group bacterium]|nr:hypothetical protein [Patescibacteria group bacterium]